MHRSLRALPLVLVAACWLACSSSQLGPGPSAGDGGGADAYSPAPDGGGADVTSPAPDSGSDAAGTTVTQTVGAAGGTVQAAGLALTIPAGAVPSDVAITITPGAGPVPSGYTGLSQLYAFGPSGTTFLVPVTVDFTLASPGVSPAIFWSNAQGGYDELSTTATPTSATASITHFSEGFCGEHRPGQDAGKEAGTDGGAVADASGPVDSGAPADSGSSSDAGPAPDGGTTGNDSGVTDAGASDAAAPGIAATIGGVVTTFAANPSATNLNGLTVVKADDSASTTHWELQLVVGTVPQEACSPNLTYPAITYTHFTGGTADITYSTKLGQGSCIVVISSTPKVTGDHASGSVLSATLNQSGDAGPASVAISSGTYNVVM